MRNNFIQKCNTPLTSLKGYSLQKQIEIVMQRNWNKTFLILTEEEYKKEYGNVPKLVEIG